MSMQGWVGMKPLRVQALMTKLQAQRTQIDDLERQLASVQNQLNWEILSKGDIDNALQRARTKIKRRRELLENVERLMRESIDEFHEKDRLKTEQKSALEYWSSMGKGAATAVTGLSSLAIAGKDALWNKVGSIFQTGVNGGNFIRGISGDVRPLLGPKTDPNEFAGHLTFSSYTEIPDDLILATPDPEITGKAEQYMAMIEKSGSRSLSGYYQYMEYGYKSKTAEDLYREAISKGSAGEEPDPRLFLANRALYNVQYDAFKSTFTEEEWEAYQEAKSARAAAKRAEREAAKPLYEKIGDKIGETVDNAVETACGWVDDRVVDVENFVDNQVEDFKTNWDGIVTDVNDFVDEHPEIVYATETVGSFVKIMGDAVSGGMALGQGNIPKFVSKAYSACNNLIDTGQNAEAVLLSIEAECYKANGKIDQALESWAEADLRANKDGLKGEFAAMDTPIGDALATGFGVLDTVNKAYSAVTGIESMFSDVVNGECFIINWKTSDGSALSNADTFFSNAKTIFGVGEGIEKGSLNDVLESIIRPAGVGGKYGDLFNIFGGIKKE